MKAYIKGNLPNAPKPTKPVKTKEQLGLLAEYDLIPRNEIEEKRRIAREHSHKSRDDSWSEEETKLLKQMLKGGYKAQEIADRLPHRTYTAVDTKIRRLRKKGEI